jgi:VanZ family protein
MKIRNWLHWLPAFALMALIFFSSSIPDTGIQTSFSSKPLVIPSFGAANKLIKKTSHAFFYGILALSYLFALQKDTQRNRKLALLLTFLYAISDEVHQLFVPTRGASFLDIAIDSLGAWIALFILKKPNSKSLPPR